MSTNLHASWTLNPQTVIEHLHAVAPSDRKQLLSLYTRMSRGGDGGQIEAWSFGSVRSVIYPSWSNEDFAAVIIAFATSK